MNTPRTTLSTRSAKWIGRVGTGMYFLVQLGIVGQCSFRLTAIRIPYPTTIAKDSPPATMEKRRNHQTTFLGSDCNFNRDSVSNWTTSNNRKNDK
jgi:hypothetical protein